MPQLLLIATVQPVMFLLLFTFVFGGAIAIPGVEYIDFLLPGILVQTVVFGSTNTAIGLTEDLAAGVIKSQAGYFPFPPFAPSVQAIIADGGLIPHLKKRLAPGG